MFSVTIPEGYSSVLSLRETQRAIKMTKDLFERNLASALNLERVTAPLIVKKESGINDDLSGVERKVHFTTKEFDLLTFLAQNPNHVYTKDELFKEIWDMESVGDIATVTVHIKKIREKIEKQSSKPQYIETIWGVGYRFKL